MNYRYFKAADLNVSLLGFGAMRLPLLEGKPAEIDETEAIRMIRHAIDSGVNYVDTAYVYHGKESEPVVGKALADGYREKVLVATKMPFWLMKSPEEMEPIFEEQLEKLNVDCIDMYLVHDISGERWDVVKKWNIWDFLVKKRSEGKIRFIGFSCHGETPEYFIDVLDAYPWDFCQLQINYMDKELQAGTKGYEYAVSKGVPIIVMEPLKGGKLTDVMPPSVQQYWDSLESDRTPAEWALRWVANLPGVITILSGMTTFEQLEENIRVLSDADAGELSEKELAVIEKAAEAYRKLVVFPCTGCKYCMPCTVDINIPLVMDYRNSRELYGETRKMFAEFKMFVDPRPSACIACGKCEAECPQHLAITRAMQETADIFERK